MSCCSSIGNVLKKIVKAIAPILAIALLAFAAYAFFVLGPAALGTVASLSWLPASVLTLSGTTAAYLALGAALIIDSDAVVDVVGDVAEGVGEVIGTVITEVVGGVGSGLFGGNFIYYALGAAALWWLLTRDEDEDNGDAIAGDADSEATFERSVADQPDKYLAYQADGVEVWEDQYD